LELGTPTAAKTSRCPRALCDPRPRIESNLIRVGQPLSKIEGLLSKKAVECGG
jgi:hypothetical protein